jgi:hypothetical protein
MLYSPLLVYPVTCRVPLAPARPSLVVQVGIKLYGRVEKKVINYKQNIYRLHIKILMYIRKTRQVR